MNLVFTKSAKGLREATGKTNDLPADLREVLKACKGPLRASRIALAWPAAERESIIWAIGELVEQGYLREAFELRGDEAGSFDEADAELSQLDFTPGTESKAPAINGINEPLPSGIGSSRQQLHEKMIAQLRQAEEIIRRKAEDLARRDAEQKVRNEAGEMGLREAPDPKTLATDWTSERLRSGIALRRGQRGEQTIEQLRQIEEKARREAEEKAQCEAEEKARREAEEKARREAEEKARREAEEKALREAEEKARREAEEKARSDAEEKVRREAAERARRKAEEKARIEVEEKVRLEEEEREREQIREKIRLRAEGRKKLLLWPLPLLAALSLMLGLYSIKFLSFDGKRIAFEKMATDVLGIQVKARRASVELIPKLQLVVEGVVIGSDSEAVTIQRVALGTSWSGLWQLPAEFDSLHLDESRVPLPALNKMFAQGSGVLPVKAGAFTASGLVIAMEPKALPPLSIEAKLMEGKLTSVTGYGENVDSGKVTLEALREGAKWQVTAAATRFVVPLGVDMPLSDFSLHMQLAPDSLTITEFKGWNNGELSGSGTISWQGSWKLAGKLAARRVDVSRLAPGWFKDGFLEGQADVAAHAPKARELYSRARIQGRIAIVRGVLSGIDLNRVIERRGLGEQFRFETLESNVSVDANRTEFTDVKLAIGAVSAGGAVTLSPEGAASGRFAIHVKTTRSPITTNLSVSGTANKPQFQR
jgi:hypothetical protein